MIWFMDVHILAEMLVIWVESISHSGMERNWFWSLFVVLESEICQRIMWENWIILTRSVQGWWGIRKVSWLICIEVSSVALWSGSWNCRFKLNSFCWMDFWLVVLNSTPPCFVNSGVVGWDYFLLLPVIIFIASTQLCALHHSLT